MAGRQQPAQLARDRHRNGVLHAHPQRGDPRRRSARSALGQLAAADPELMRAEGGQAIVLIAIVMAGLTLGVGLAADTGELYVARRAAQTAADSAAWAGAVVLLGGGTQAAAAAAATADATRNGLTAGPGTTITRSEEHTSELQSRLH